MMPALLLLTLALSTRSADAVSPGKLHQTHVQRADSKGLWILAGAYSSDAALTTQAVKALPAALGADGSDLADTNTKLLPLKLPQPAGVEALVARLEKQTLTISFVGNLGVIRVRAGKAERLNLPHSIIEDFIAQKGVPPEEQEMIRLQAPHRFVSVRSLGKGPDVAVGTATADVAKGDKLVLANVDVLASTPLRLFADVLRAAKDPGTAARLLQSTGSNARPGASPAAIVVFVE